MYENAMSHHPFWDISNGRTLCVSCHMGFNNKNVTKVKKKFKNLLTFKGRTQTMVEWCKELRISHRTACGRQERGLSVEEILSTTSLILKKENIFQLTYNNVTKPVTVWCRELGLNSKLVKRRIIELGWSVEEALNYPHRQKKFNGNSTISYKNTVIRPGNTKENRIKLGKHIGRLKTN